MSTKIHHGYRIRGSDGQEPNLLAFTSRLSAVLTPLFHAAYVTELASAAVSVVDQLTVPADSAVPQPAPSGVRLDVPTATAWGKLSAAAQVVRDGRRVPELDFQCEVTFLGDEDGTYALLFTERGDYTTAFEAMSEVSEFAYWDNTDRPDELTEQQWDDRRQLWNRILGWDAPATCGLTWKLNGTCDAPSPGEVADEVVAAVPSRDDRARAVARTRVRAASIEDGQVVWRDIADVRADVDAEAARIEPLLLDITRDDLYDDTTVNRLARTALTDGGAARSTS